jgi:head-tail adaptor
MIGKLDRRIRLETPRITIDDYGQEVVTYLGWIEMFAKVEYKNSDEAIRADVKVDEQTVEFTVRVSNAIRYANKLYRIIFQNMVYDIEGITFIGRNRWAVIRGVSRGALTTNQSQVQIAVAEPSFNLPYTLPFLLG